ncbi:hypothetical protein G6F24_015996 [Rhizopus arrhizus]|nr:hypothetical protein G6F24_015996 [Rhizopus arrhizus]
MQRRTRGTHDLYGDVAGRARPGQVTEQRLHAAHRLQPLIAQRRQFHATCQRGLLRQAGACPVVGTADATVQNLAHRRADFTVAALVLPDHGVPAVHEVAADVEHRRSLQARVHVLPRHARLAAAVEQALDAIHRLVDPLHQRFPRLFGLVEVVLDLGIFGLGVRDQRPCAHRPTRRTSSPGSS